MEVRGRARLTDDCHGPNGYYGSQPGLFCLLTGAWGLREKGWRLLTFTESLIDHAGQRVSRSFCAFLRPLGLTYSDFAVSSLAKLCSISVLTLQISIKHSLVLHNVIFCQAVALVSGNSWYKRRKLN
jgi:hypothetical protein